MDEFAIPAAFEQIWERVTALSPDMRTPLTLQKELEYFIQGEERSIEAYKIIAERVCPRERQLIYQLLADERRHLRCLQMEYFMLIGNTYAPTAAGSGGERGVLTMLRDAYMAETGAAEAYAQAAEGRAAEISELYTLISREEAAHARALKCMIERCFKEQE